MKIKTSAATFLLTALASSSLCVAATESEVPVNISGTIVDPALGCELGSGSLNIDAGNANGADVWVDETDGEVHLKRQNNVGQVVITCAPHTKTFITFATNDANSRNFAAYGSWPVIIDPGFTDGNGFPDYYYGSPEAAISNKNPEYLSPESRINGYFEGASCEGVGGSCTVSGKGSNLNSAKVTLTTGAAPENVAFTFGAQLIAPKRLYGEVKPSPRYDVTGGAPALYVIYDTIAQEAAADPAAQLQSTVEGLVPQP